MYMHVAKAAYESQSEPETVIYSGKGGTQTQWIFERYENTQYYYIISVHNGLGLSLAGDPPNDQKDKPIELSSQLTADDFLWYLSDEGNGKVSICNKATKQCLYVKGGGTTNDTWIQQYTPNHSSAQLWTLETRAEEGYPGRMKIGFIMQQLEMEIFT